MNSFNVSFSSSSKYATARDTASDFSSLFELDETKGWSVAVTDFDFPQEVVLQCDELFRTHKDLSEERVLKSKKPTKICLRSWPTLRDTLVYIGETFKNLLKVTWNKTHCTWKVINSNYLVILSNPLRHAVCLWQDVLTPWDKSAKNCSPVDYEQTLPSDQYMIFVPKSYKHTSYQFKDDYEVFSCDKLLKFMRMHGTVEYDQKILRLGAPDESYCHVFSEALHTLLPFNQAGTCANTLRRQWDGKCNVEVNTKWILHVYHLSDMTVYQDPYDPVGAITSVKTVLRPENNSSFLDLLNNLLKPKYDIVISLQYDDRVIITMDDKAQKLVIGEKLKQILGFESNTFIAPNTYVSQRPMSTGFYHLYVHCNLVDFTQYGTAESQILLSVPLKSNDDNYQPIYTPLYGGKATQIDFLIRNEKGDIVVFPPKTSTSLKLNFRQ